MTRIDVDKPVFSAHFMGSDGRRRRRFLNASSVKEAREKVESDSECAKFEYVRELARELVGNVA